MPKGLTTLIGVNSLTMLLTTITTMIIAGKLGPNQFGNFALTQAIAAILGPVTMLRLETRILMASSHEQLTETYHACVTISGITSILAISIATLISTNGTTPYAITYCAIIIATSSSLIETSAYLEAHKGNTKNVANYRFLRGAIPGITGCFSAIFFKDFGLCLFFYTAGLALATTFVLYKTGLASFSVADTKKTLRKDPKAIKSTFLLGILNAIWLNTTLPIMQILGMNQIAGQYAISQRIISTPLSIISSAINTTLFNHQDETHKSRFSILKLTATCLFVAAAYCTLLFFIMYIQNWLKIPNHWLMNRDFFCSTSFFLVSSFVVGSISNIAIKQRDESFILYWQALFLLIFFGILFFSPNKAGVIMTFILGGLSYWILLWRWTWTAKVKHGKNSD